jgi:hypothetical protein
MPGGVSPHFDIIIILIPAKQLNLSIFLPMHTIGRSKSGSILEVKGVPALPNAAGDPRPSAVLNLSVQPLPTRMGLQPPQSASKSDT